MIAELKAMACLLVYPRKQLIDELGDIRLSIKSCTTLDEKVKAGLATFINNLATVPLTTAQRVYVATFDMGKSASLNLFAHLHGDSRNKGAAMINLIKLYSDHGLKFESEELPDFLPAILEFLSGLSFKEAQMWLQSAAPLIGSIDKELQLMRSPWQAVTEALLAFSEMPRKLAEVAIDDFVPSLDAQWQDQAVKFGERGNPVQSIVRFDGK